MENLDRMKELVATLNKWAKLYYEEDAPVVSDAEYDRLYDELRKLESESGTVLPDSPTKRVGGAPKKKFEQSTHLRRLYSLDKCQSFEELEDWYNKVVKAVGKDVKFTCEYKFDGLTLNLLYDGGKLIKGTTRGNGTVGEVVTEQVKTIKSIPHTIPYDGKIEIQGEGILKLSDLKKYNETAAEPLKNARNGAAGAIRNLDPNETAKRNLSFAAYNVGYNELEFSSQEAMRELLVSTGFTLEGEYSLVSSFKEMKDFAESVERNRDDLDYLIDGVVFKVNDVGLREQLGYTEKFPKWAVAFKFKAEEMTTVLKDVVWQVSRSAKLNPIAVLEPVDIGGVTVSRATLNNFGDIQKKRVKIGDRVFVRRSNDVIPEIMGVAEEDKNATPIAKPKYCPICHAPVKEVGAFLYCTGDECAPKTVASLDHFASKDCMDIDGFSSKTAELLYNEVGVKTPADLMRLKKEDLISYDGDGNEVKLDGFGDKKAENLINNIEKAKTCSLPSFIFALGIDGVGKKTAKDLVKRFKTLDSLKSASLEDLCLVDGVGGIIAKSVYDYFRNADNLKLIDELIDLGINFKEEETKSGAFSGMKVVLTGSLPTYKRGEATKLIEDNGGEVASSVSKTVNLVLAGEDAGSKLAKAKTLGIKIIDEEEFKRMLNL